MKKLVMVLLLAAFAVSMLAEEAFFQGTIDAALVKAKKEDKILFLKFYSDT